MSRPIYLVVYHSRLFAAHWALWIPTFENETVGDIGKAIHVEGSPREGFSLVFKRNYDMSTTSRSKSIIFLCQVDARNIVDTPGDGSFTTDTTASDAVEDLALKIAAPGPSLRSSNASGSRSRVELQNCQTWLRALVVALIENGILSEEALLEVDQAPKN